MRKAHWLLRLTQLGSTCRESLEKRRARVRLGGAAD
jgi:hypothetical protein